MKFSLAPSTQTVAVSVAATITITMTPPVAAGQPFALSDGGAGGVFVPSNASPLITTPNEVSVSFTYTNASVGVYTITATPSQGALYPLNGQGPQSVQVVVTSGSPPAPISFSVAPASQSTTPNAPTGLFTITLMNGSAPAVAGGGGQAFDLTSTDALAGFSSSVVTVPAGASSISFTYSSPSIGTATITATAEGSPYSVNSHTATVSISTSGGSGGSGGSTLMSGVPQSGRSSAVGLCIESAFRSTPLTPVSGALNSVGIAATNPLRFFIVEPNGGFPVKPTKEVGESEIDGDFEVHRTTMTGKMYDGKDSFKADPENLYYPLLGLFGRDVETTLTAGAYQHVFTFSGGPQPSFTMEEQFGDKTVGRLSSGLCIAALTMNHSAILTTDITYYAHRQIPNRYPAAGNVDTDYDFTSTPGLLPSQLGGDHTKTVKLTVAPSYVDVAEGNCGNGPLVFANSNTGTASGFSNTFVTINDVAYNAQILPGWTADLARSIERFMVGGSGYDAGVPVASLFKCSGKMDVLFTDNTFAANTLANCKFGINMRFTGAQIGNTGYYYSYEIYMPRVKFLDDTVTRTDKAMTCGGAFQAEKDPALGYSCKVTIVNSFTHASLAGAYPQPGLGLQGWLAA